MSHLADPHRVPRSPPGRRRLSKITPMAEDEVSVTLDSAVLAAADADAKATGLNRSQLIEQALRHEHLRIALKSYTTHTVPALNIDDYAAQIYQANRSAGL